MELAFRELSLRFKRPLQTAYATLEQRQLLLVCLRHNGLEGWGEAAPLEPYDGVALERAARALRAYAPTLGQSKLPAVEGIARLLAKLRQVDPLPQALAGVELALLDLIGKATGLAAHRLLGATAAQPVVVGAAIDAASPAQAALAAQAAVARGITTLKVKVGTGDDAGRVAAVRSTAPQAALRLDANGSWSASQAVAQLELLAPFGPSLCEEPCPGLGAQREVGRACSLPIYADESAPADPAAAAGRVAGVCLRLGRLGGPLALLGYARAARNLGLGFYLASTYDGPLGVAGALAAAAALAGEGPLEPCGLATLDQLQGEWSQLAVVDGAIRPPEGPGLGVEPPAAHP